MECCSVESEQACGPQECGPEMDDRLAGLVWAAKAAKMELLQDKMKARLEEKDGARLDRLADVGVEALLELRRGRLESAKRLRELADALDKACEDG